MKERKLTLWTKDYTCITLATILTAIGGEAMSLPVMLMVFEETGSTMLSSIILICSMLPDIILPVLVAPFIDKGSKKKWIVGLDITTALLYIGMGVWVCNYAFHYVLYVIFILSVGTISVFYRLAYNAWFPDLIPKGFEQKGYAFSETIYPCVVIVMAPVATFLYENTTMSFIFVLVGSIAALAVLVESMVEEKKKVSTNEQTSYSLAKYKADIVDGFAYMKREKGIRNIYTYMSISQGISTGNGVIIQAFFQTHPVMSVTMLGLLQSVEMIGRAFGGMVQYKVEIPPKKRYGITKFVYTFYEIADILILYLPYPLMAVLRFFCGAMGITSATIRGAATQSYIQEDMRARVNALFQVFFAVGGIVFQLVAGGLGQVLPYRMVTVLLGIIGLTAIWFLIVLPDKENRKVYEAVRE